MAKKTHPAGLAEQARRSELERRRELPLVWLTPSIPACNHCGSQKARGVRRSILGIVVCLWLSTWAKLVLRIARNRVRFGAYTRVEASARPWFVVCMQLEARAEWTLNSGRLCLNRGNLDGS